MAVYGAVYGTDKVLKHHCRAHIRLYMGRTNFYNTPVGPIYGCIWDGQTFKIPLYGTYMAVYGTDKLLKYQYWTLYGTDKHFKSLYWTGL